jgi:hypothetical protein
VIELTNGRNSDLPADETIAVVGGPIDEVDVSLCIYGDDLDPDELTRIMGASPTSTRRRGDLSSSGHPARIGNWILRSGTSKSTPIEQQAKHLLSLVTSDPLTWTELSQRFRVQLRCGLHLSGWNRGDGLSAEAMQELGRRGIDFVMDIYGPDDDMPEGLQKLVLPRKD